MTPEDTAAFWALVVKHPHPNGCWFWGGGRLPDGYGQFHDHDKKRARLAHHIAYDLTVGPVPVDAVLDHLCSNKECVNPAHLDPVSQAENVRRGKLRWKANESTRRLRAPEPPTYTAHVVLPETVADVLFALSSAAPGKWPSLDAYLAYLAYLLTDIADERVTTLSLATVTHPKLRERVAAYRDALVATA